MRGEEMIDQQNKDHQDYIKTVMGYGLSPYGENFKERCDDFLKNSEKAEREFEIWLDRKSNEHRHSKSITVTIGIIPILFMIFIIIAIIHFW